MKQLSPKDLEKALKYLDNPWEEKLPPELKELTELDWEVLQIMFNNLQDERAHAQLH
jgi:hypothetical protein